MSQQELAEELYRRKMEKRAMRGKEDLSIDHKFWSTQPMLSFGETSEEHCPIEPQRTVEEVKQDEYSMPAGNLY